MEETWKDIKGYEGRYQVSNMGRVKTINRHKSDGRIQKEKIRISEIDHRGYEFVLLYNENGYKRYSVHVLVANAFIPNPNNKPQINHIDGNKINNIANNLEWVTASENQMHAIRNGLSKPKRGEEHTGCKLTYDNVQQIRKMRQSGKTYYEIGREFNVSYTYVGRIIRGERRVSA